MRPYMGYISEPKEIILFGSQRKGNTIAARPSSARLVRCVDLYEISASIC